MIGGEAGPGPSYLDPGSGGPPQNDFTNRNTTFMTWNLMHLAQLLRNTGGGYRPTEMYGRAGTRGAAMISPIRNTAERITFRLDGRDGRRRVSTRRSTAGRR